MVKKNNFLQSKKLLYFQGLASKHFGRWLTYHNLIAIKHQPTNAELINKVFKNCVIMIFMMKVSKSAKNKILYILECPLKNKWTTFLDKLVSCNDQNILTILLFKILAQELISKEKGYKPFWTAAFADLSEKLLLPTETDYVGLHSNSSNQSFKKVEELSKYLTMTTTLAKKTSFHKTSSLLSTSLTVDKWEKDLISEKTNRNKMFKTVIMKLYPTKIQSQILDGFIDTHRFVYNRTLEYIKNGYEPFFEPLRDLLATENTRKNYSCVKYYELYLNSIKNTSEELLKHEKKEITNEIRKLKLIKNPLIYDFELNTSNEIRSNAIKSVCDAYKSGFSNLKAGNIKYFNMNFKKKSEQKKCIELATTDINFCKTGFKISPTKFPKNEKIIKISKNNQEKYKNILIKNNCDLVKFKGEYFIHLTVPCQVLQESKQKQYHSYCGIDPGVRTLLSIYGNHELKTIELKENLFKRLNDKIEMLKAKRIKPLLYKQRSSYRKKQINKVEKKKLDSINMIHWDVINYLVKTQDVIFFGDIKSHNIVKNNKNTTLNTDLNDLKFFQLKQKLKYKCIVNNKKVFFINEAYTTQGCSSCGNLWKNIGSSKKYVCNNQSCRTYEQEFDRDFNAAKNICMKGLISVC